MGNIVAVLGETGSGKSRSIKNLTPEDVVVVNVLGKDLPFKGSRSAFNSENRTMFRESAWENVVALIRNISENSTKKYLIIDDARYIMEKEFMKRAKEVGYSRFTEIAQHFQAIIDAGEQSRSDLTIVLMLHDDDIVNDKAIVGKKVKTVGKMIDDHYNPMEVVPICLYCKPSFEKGTPVYQFYTQKTIVNGIEYPAKTPEGMFNSLTIPNDLAIVFAAIDEYYK